MKPLDPAAANYIQRFTSPDERTVFDLVWVFEPDDFRELGGQRRPQVYDNATGETVLNLLNCDCGVRSHEWGDDGSLILTMSDGAGVQIWIAQGQYASNIDDWAVRRLAEMQADIAARLGAS